MLDLLNAYFSEWYLCVWNCKGELRKKWEKEPEHWLDIGYFKVPVKEKVTLTQEEIEKFEQLLFDVLDEQGGAINISGLYPVSDYYIEQINTILKGKLYE